MKKLELITLLTVGLGASVSSQAALVSILGGQAYYDDVLNVSWVADANLAASMPLSVGGVSANGMMTWGVANNWVNQVNASNYLGVSGWRLPVAAPVNGSNYNLAYAEDGSTDTGLNITSPNSELAYMFYQNLGNVGVDQPNFGIGNSGPFSNLGNDIFWTGSSLPGGDVLVFDNFFGEQFDAPKSNQYSAWLVHDGDISAVPVPAALWLFGSGLIGLVGVARRRHK